MMIGFSPLLCTGLILGTVQTLGNLLTMCSSLQDDMWNIVSLPILYISMIAFSVEKTPTPEDRGV